MDFSHLPLFTVTRSKSEEYGDWVKQTCILLYGSEVNSKGETVCKRGKYYPLAKIFEKEKWTLEEIRSAYHNAVKYCGKVTPAVAWWSNRKRRNGT